MRLLDILFYLLRSNCKVTIKELATIFNVSTKTIRRDLDKLSILGIPIIIYRGADGGVEVDKNYIIAKHVLRYDDYKSLIFALYIGENISKNISESYLIDKFKSVDRDRCSEILENINERFIVDLYEKEFDTETEICKEIDKSLDNKSFILLEIEGDILEVYPISYVLRKEGLCLYCCSDEYLIIPIDKISKATISNKAYNNEIISYTDNKGKIKILN